MKRMFASVLLLSFGLCAAPAATGSATAQKCLEEGKRLEKLANREGRDSQKQFEQALQKYLCAAHGGSAQGAQKAAELSTSGMAPRFSDSAISALFQQSIQLGIDSELIVYAGFICGETGFDSCRNPKESLRLLNAAKAKGFNVTLYVATLLLDPLSPISDSSRSYACTKLFGGKKWPKIRVSYLAHSPNLDTTKSCEPKP